MNGTEYPRTADELAATLACAASARKTIELGGNFSKRAGAGPIQPCDVTISTAHLNRILAYEPRDLTISVEAGITYAELTRALTPNRQMIPLDPPFSAQATMGGIVAANSSGPRRCQYGTARDLVIGMKFATLEGKLIQSGGMVVKNVAGLDMGKLLIGSWGTLAAMASINFKLQPIPAVERTMIVPADSLAAACQLCDKVRTGVLQPSAMDIVNARAAAELGYDQPLVAVEFGGNEAVIERSRRGMRECCSPTEPTPEESLIFWSRIRNFTSRFLQKVGGGTVVRISTVISDIREVMETLDVPAIARGGSAVIYACFSESSAAVKFMAANSKLRSVIEYAPLEEKEKLDLWPSPGAEMEIMKRIKVMFDPHNLLNRGRYYRHF